SCLAGKIQELDTEATAASGQTSFLRKHFVEPHGYGVGNRNHTAPWLIGSDWSGAVLM
ncbi:hypothetical protein CHARACLAT_032497, partial [Characodon lateralis]|nr:hypothetical protein [Characodon lateralis]